MDHAENDREDREIREEERKLARDFMREVLEPSSADSQVLEFKENWEAKAESFLIEIHNSYDQDTTTALLAILVNASKALVDHAHQNQSSDVRYVAHTLFEYIRVAALKFSRALRESVEVKKRERDMDAAKVARQWDIDVLQIILPKASTSARAGGKSLVDLMISRCNDCA